MNICVATHRSVSLPFLNPPSFFQIQTMKGAFFTHKAGMADGVDARLVEVAQRSVQGLPLDPLTIDNIVKAI